MNAKKIAAVALAAATTLSMSAPVFAGPFNLDARNAITHNDGKSTVDFAGFANYDFGGVEYNRSYVVDSFKKGAYLLNLEGDKKADPALIEDWSVHNNASVLSSDEVNHETGIALPDN